MQDLASQWEAISQFGIESMAVGLAKLIRKARERTALGGTKGGVTVKEVRKRWVTMGVVFGCKRVQTLTRIWMPSKVHYYWLTARLGSSMQTLQGYSKRPIHADNMGSNPIGDTKLFPWHTHLNVLESLAIRAVVETIFCRPLLLRLRFTSIHRMIWS
jgi:hypothetical protein